MPKRLLLVAVLLAAAVVTVALLSGRTRSKSRAAPRSSRDAGEGEQVAEPRPGKRLCGRVVENVTDAPIAGATVTAYAFASGRVLTATAAPDGTFELPVAGDAFELVARHEGFGAASMRVVREATPIIVRLSGTAGIRGIVVAANGGSPVPDCPVAAARLPRQQDFNGSLLRSLLPADLLIESTASTGADGTFELKGLAPGLYGLLIEPQGMSPVPYRPHTGPDTGLCTVEVRAGEVADVRIRAAPLGGKLVQVFDQDTGQPLNGVRFEAQAPACRSACVPLAAEELEPGAYWLQAGSTRQTIRLRVSRDGYGRRVVDFPTFGPLDIGPKAPIGGPSELDQFLVALGRAAAVSGHVRAAGEPVRGAILVVTERGEDEAMATGSTGPDGAFELRGLDPCRCLEIHVYDRSLDPIAVVSLSLKSGERRTIEVGAPGTTAVEGRVVIAGEPVANAAVTLRGETYARSTTGQDGQYRFEGLDAGRHRLTVDTSGGGYLTRHVEVAEGQRVRLDLDAARSIEGVVVDAQTGLPVTDASHLGVVALGADSENRAFVYAGEDGRFRLPVDPGVCRIDCWSIHVYAVEQPTVDMAQATVPEIVLRVSRGSGACIVLDLRDERTGEPVADGACEYTVGGDRYRESTRYRGGPPLSVRGVSPGLHRIRVWSDAYVPTDVEVRVEAGLKETRERVSLRRAEAVRVAWVSRDGEAARAGLRPGDVIVSCNGFPTPSIAALHSALVQAQGAVRVAIEFERDGERKGAVLIPVADLDRIPRFYDPLPGLENILLGR